MIHKLMLKSVFGPKASKHLKIVRERPTPEETKRFRKARSQQALYRAACQLWLKGLNMTDAIRIVSEAVDETAMAT